jgi:hypothetical protein
LKKGVWRVKFWQASQNPEHPSPQTKQTWPKTSIQ